MKNGTGAEHTGNPNMHAFNLTLKENVFSIFKLNFQRIGLLQQLRKKSVKPKLYCMCHLAVPFKRTIAATQKWNLWWLIEIVQAVQKRKCQREMSLTVLCSSVYIRYKKAYYLLPKTTYDILKHLDKLLWTLILNMLWNGKLGSWILV